MRTSAHQNAKKAPIPKAAMAKPMVTEPVAASHAPVRKTYGDAMPEAEKKDWET